MGQIKSNAISAGSAISELVGVDTSNTQNQQVEFSYTTGMLEWKLAVRPAIKCFRRSVISARLF